MVKDVKHFLEVEQITMFLQGTSYPMFVANMDRENYEIFRSNQVDDFSENTIRDMNVLSVLERLGYSLDELGTYLYKDVIVENKEVDRDKIVYVKNFDPIN